MMSIQLKNSESNFRDNEVVQSLYESYAKKLLAYTCKTYHIAEDDAWTLVYKSIYKMADMKERYSFENESQRSSFIFKMHINHLRDFFRSHKSYEKEHAEVEFKEECIPNEDSFQEEESLQMKILRQELDKFEDWQRILLLMRGQGMPYSEIAVFVNKPENQLKVYYARLKKQLLENLNHEIKLNTIYHAPK